MASQRKVYPGIHRDHYEGMTDIGRIIRDAWVLGVLPEEETCEGWDFDRLQNLYNEVHEAWDAYGHLVSNLPSELRERHERIHGAAFRRARELGWSPNMADED